MIMPMFTAFGIEPTRLRRASREEMNHLRINQGIIRGETEDMEDQNKQSVLKEQRTQIENVENIQS
jgi:hypothetical protein